MSAHNDPSGGVPRDLLPHVHLLSTYRYPAKVHIQPQEVVGMLMQAPKIARETATFCWTYLDRPANGSVSLTWQPSTQMGINFSSDGYIWPPQEQFFQQDVGNGVVLEMYIHKAGYAYGEQMATHSRRRFRLSAARGTNPNTPLIDPNLWIVHYGPVENNEAIPANMIQGDPRVPRILETRNYLQRCGQIARKEFILGDRANWPRIDWPREPPRQPMYPNSRGVPQNMAYPPHPGPPSKRARTNQASQAQAGVMPPMDSAWDDDEDVSRGDLFDHLTPREISLMRYQQNHEWMEEILSSPYRMGQIGFSDLGLGLKGELSSVTDGIFDAPGPNAVAQSTSKAPGSNMDPEQAAEFRKRVDERISSTNAEIAKMKAEHAKQLEKFKKNSIFTVSEKELRTATDGSTINGLPLDAHLEESDDGSSKWSSKHSKKVDDIVSQVEAHLGRRAEVIHDLKRMQAGGYQEPAPEPVPEPTEAPGTAAAAGDGASRQGSNAGSQSGGGVGGDSDVDMGGTAAGLLDQMHTGLSGNSTPNNNMPTPPQQNSAGQSNTATPAVPNTASPQPATNQTGAGQKPAEAKDVTMDGTGTASAPDQGTGSGDWVVVPKGGEGDAPAAAANQAPKGPDASSKQASASGTPAGGSGSGFDGGDFGSMGDLDTAGEALGSFSGTPGDLDLNMEMEDSAFGDAFHGVEPQSAGGGTPGGN